MLEQVATLLRKANLTINLEKSRFVMKEIKYLGYLVGEQGLRTDPEKIEAITKFPVPINAKQTRVDFWAWRDGIGVLLRILQ